MKNVNKTYYMQNEIELKYIIPIEKIYEVISLKNIKDINLQNISTTKTIQVYFDDSSMILYKNNCTLNTFYHANFLPYNYAMQFKYNLNLDSQILQRKELLEKVSKEFFYKIALDDKSKIKEEFSKLFNNVNINKLQPKIGIVQNRVKKFFIIGNKKINVSIDLGKFVYLSSNNIALDFAEIEFEINTNNDNSKNELILLKEIKEIKELIENYNLIESTKSKYQRGINEFKKCFTIS